MSEALSIKLHGFNKISLVWSRLLVYYEFLRNSFLVMLAYRLRYYMGIVTYLLFVSVNYFIWDAVFAGHEPGSQINGFTVRVRVRSVGVGWVARSLYFSNIDYDIDEIVRTGQISNWLIRPVHFHVMVLCQSAGEAFFRLLFFTLPIGVVILNAFPVMPPASCAYFLLFALGTVFSFLILAEIGFLVGMLAFPLKSIQGIIRAKYFLIQVFSGLLLPPSFFPWWLSPVVEYLPFKMIAYVPLQFYLGRLPLSAALPVLVSQVLWLLVLYAIGQWCWRGAVRNLTIQGG